MEEKPETAEQEDYESGHPDIYPDPREWEPVNGWDSGGYRKRVFRAAEMN